MRIALLTGIGIAVFAAMGAPAFADCVQSINTVTCTGNDPDGFGTGNENL